MAVDAAGKHNKSSGHRFFVPTCEIMSERDNRPSADSHVATDDIVGVGDCPATNEQLTGRYAIPLEPRLAILRRRSACQRHGFT
jgi:hypothetical protein